MERNFKKTKLLASFSVLFVFIMFLFMLSGVQSQISVGNKSADILDKYSGGDNLQGWLNLSLVNEPYNSVFSVTSGTYSASMSLIDLLKKNSNLPYSCTMRNCNMTYIASDNGTDASRSFPLDSGASKVLGMMLTEPSAIEDITSLQFTLSSSALEDCNSPAQIDIGDDGIIDWIADKYNLNSYCGSSQTYASCYNASAVVSTPMTANAYCEYINVSSASALRVGADIIAPASGGTGLRFSVDGVFCDNDSVSSSGKVGCTINMTITKPTRLEVCVQIKSGNYQLAYETTAPFCGTDGQTDFGIFVQPLKFAALGTISLNGSYQDSSFTSFAGIAKEYIDRVYLGNCSAGCLIPIKIYSGVNGQQITLSDAKMTYLRSEIYITSNKTYELSLGPSKINSGYMKIFLNNSGLKVPSSAGAYNITFKIGDAILATKKIEVVSLPNILDFYPKEVPAGIDVPFAVLASGTNITGYLWDFGDNSSIVETTTGFTVHKYSAIMTRTVKLTIKSSVGNRNFTFDINVTSPKNYLNMTLAYYESKTSFLRSQLSAVPPAARARIESAINISDMEGRVAALRAEYGAAGNSSTKYLELLSAISAVTLPEMINVTLSSSGPFIIDSQIISASSVATLTSEEVALDQTVLRNAIFDWFLNSVDVTGDFKTYSAIYRTSNNILLTYGSFRITPKSGVNVDSLYAVINKPSSSISVSGASSPTALDSATGFSLTPSASGSNLEIIFNEPINMFDAPVYFFPSLADLSILNVSVCNFNKICDKNLGEDYNNCRFDCKPVARTVWLLVFLLVLFLVAYIAAQEWYKKRYEDYLFKDKNDLFNLINFMDNGEKQGFKKEESFSKLREKGWHNEQMNYAYNKFKGKRTGMFEIPVFGVFEKRKVAEQLELRKKIGMNPNITPRPIRTFVPGVGKPMGFMNKSASPASVNNLNKPAVISPAASQPSLVNMPAKSASAAPQNVPPQVKSPAAPAVQKSAAAQNNSQDNTKK